jgi:hypothetical protein
MVEGVGLAGLAAARGLQDAREGVSRPDGEPEESKALALRVAQRRSHQHQGLALGRRSQQLRPQRPRQDGGAGQDLGDETHDALGLGAHGDVPPGRDEHAVGSHAGEADVVILLPRCTHPVAQQLLGGSCQQRRARILGGAGDPHQLLRVLHHPVVGGVHLGLGPLPLRPDLDGVERGVAHDPQLVPDLLLRRGLEPSV